MYQYFTYCACEVLTGSGSLSSFWERLKQWAEWLDPSCTHYIVLRSCTVSECTVHVHCTSLLLINNDHLRYCAFRPSFNDFCYDCECRASQSNDCDSILDQMLTWCPENCKNGPRTVALRTYILLCGPGKDITALCVGWSHNNHRPFIYIALHQGVVKYCTPPTFICSCTCEPPVQSRTVQCTSTTVASGAEEHGAEERPGWNSREI